MIGSMKCCLDFCYQITGYWDGLIGEVLSGGADLIVAPLTATAERASVVDLTNSFLEVNQDIISELYTKRPIRTPKFSKFVIW